MHIRGRTGEDRWGHSVLINDVSWVQNDDGSCSMEIECVNTGRQDPNRDFEGIPYDPGTDTYRITTDADGNTTVTSSVFTGSEISRLVYDSFDEQPR